MPQTGQPADPVAAPLEVGLSVLEGLSGAPPRTLHLPSIVRSSPLSPSVRAMIERRDFGGRYDGLGDEVPRLQERLPGLDCPAGDVEFLADCRSFEDLSASVDDLLSHRKRLLAPTLDARRPRRDVLILGAGPGGLMTAVQLGLRDHRVVVCEQHDAYTRNRFIGVYKDVAHLMAALGMPEAMTYDFTHYRGKRGMMLADIQTFLHAIALKLGVIIYTGTVPRQISSEAVRSGQLELARSPRARLSNASGIGLTRWHRDAVALVRSGVCIRFDTIVEATGGRSGLREVLVGSENVVSLRHVAQAAAARDPSLGSFFDDPEDHCAEFVESEYGCPPDLRASFATALMGDAEEIPRELPCFVSNIDASVLTKPIRPTEKAAGVGARIAERELDIPPDWVVVECPLSDGRLTRYQIEGPLPQSFGFGGERVPTREWLDRVNPLSLLVRVLYAMGVPFDAVDRERLVDFAFAENSKGDASDVVATWLGTFQGLRLGGDEPIWTGLVAGSDSLEYAVVGEALQNAWYRFGVGVDDTFAAAARFAEGGELAPDARRLQALRFEQVMLARAVQVLYHLYAVAQHTAQGVVGPVLTEYHIDEQRKVDLAAAQLRSEAGFAAEMVAAEADIRSDDPDHLLGSALDRLIEATWHRVLALLESFPYDAQLLRRASQQPGEDAGRSRSEASHALARALSREHRELILPLLERASPTGTEAADAATHGPRHREERIIDLALGRYRWVTPWVRACALRILDPASPAAMAALARAATDGDPLVSETAAATLSGMQDARHYGTVEKVVLLRAVSLFAAIPHEVLADVAPLLSACWAEPGERIVGKGEPGDCLYLIASGSVRVHDGDRALRVLGPFQYFGEMSLLDGGSRAADVTAVEPSHLFRLGHEAFFPLMTERPEIAHAINRALCAEVRALSDAGGRR